METRRLDGVITCPRMWAFLSYGYIGRTCRIWGVIKDFREGVGFPADFGGEIQDGAPAQGYLKLPEKAILSIAHE